MSPLVSVITPTWNRHDLLFERCIDSVAAQTYENFEHIIVSDGPDETLSRVFRQFPGEFDYLRYFELPEHTAGHIGNPARLFGIEQAQGEYIAYLDDDDAYRPEHVALHVAALEESGSYFSKSFMLSHKKRDELIGNGAPCPGGIGTPMIVHRRELLDIATWGASGEMEDWELVKSWLDAGVQWTSIDEITIDVWPSTFYGGRP